MPGVEMMWFECIASLVTVSEEKKRKKDVRGFLSDRFAPSARNDRGSYLEFSPVEGWWEEVCGEISM